MASLTQWRWVWVKSGVGDGQGGLGCCSPWDCKELDMTERLNWTEPRKDQDNNTNEKLISCQYADAYVFNLTINKNTQITENYKFTGSSVQFSSVQSLSHVLLFVTPWTAAPQTSLSISNSRSLLKLMSIKSVMPSNHLILSSPSPSALNFSQRQGLF